MIKITKSIYEKVVCCSCAKTIKEGEEIVEISINECWDNFCMECGDKEIQEMKSSIKFYDDFINFKRTNRKTKYKVMQCN